jgi:predicted acetyltransferase
MVTLEIPSRDKLPRYVAALERRWSPHTMRDEVIDEELAEIARDADAVLAHQVDRATAGGPVTLPDGSKVARLPGLRLWIWDGDFCGMINLRWQKGTSELPPHVLGHIGYGVVPWKRGRGYATQALGLMLRQARREGLAEVVVSTDPDNIASQRVIEANGGVERELFTRPAAYGHSPGVRYRVPTPAIER